MGGAAEKLAQCAVKHGKQQAQAALQVNRYQYCE